MSMHKQPLTELERSGLEKHHLPIGTPSQLSDCFRLGIAYARAAIEAQRVPDCNVVDRSFRWDGVGQCHFPRLIMEFESVPFDGPNNSKGWKDRDALAAMLSSAPPMQHQEMQAQLAEARKDAERFQFIVSNCEVFHDGQEVGSTEELDEARGPSHTATQPAQEEQRRHLWDGSPTPNYRVTREGNP